MIDDYYRLGHTVRGAFAVAEVLPRKTPGAVHFIVLLYTLWRMRERQCGLETRKRFVAILCNAMVFASVV